MPFSPPFTEWFLYDIQHQYIDDLNSRFMCILLVIFVIYNYSIDIQMLYDIHVIKSYVQCFNQPYYSAEREKVMTLFEINRKEIWFQNNTLGLHSEILKRLGHIH